MTVTATDSSTARTLADRFAEVFNVKDFGATGDGTTDDYAAIAAAIAALPTRGGIVFFPPGVYAHSQVIQVGNGTSSLASTTQNIMLIGQTVPNGELSTINSATRLKYTGSAAAANIRVNGPITCAVIGFHLDSNFLAEGGIYATHAFFSRFENLYVGKYMGSAYKLDSYNSHAQCTNGANDNRWINIHCAQPGANDCVPFEIGNAVKSAGNLGTSRNLISTFSFKCGDHADGRGIVLRHCDIVKFEMGIVHAGVAAASCAAKLIEVAPPTGSTSFPQAIRFENVAIICDPVTNWEIASGWTADIDDDAGIYFDPFLKADIEGATNKSPSHKLIYGFNEEGEPFGKVKYAPLDLMEYRSVISATTTAQPGSPANEDIYIIPGSATGADWSTFAVGSFAQYRTGIWVEIVPVDEGWRAYVQDQNRVLTWSGSAWGVTAPTVQVFTASGTYTPSVGITAVIVEVRGGGGGGGGVSNAAGALAAAGGAQGGYARKRILASALGSTETITVGTGGAAGTSGGGNGASGNTSSFGSHCSATGGTGGGGTSGAGMLGGGTGGTASSGDINISGQGGGNGVGLTGTGPSSGLGGGEGGGRGRVTTGAGIDGADGGGGGGAASAAGTTANAGGVGGDGYVIVTEFYS